MIICNSHSKMGGKHLLLSVTAALMICLLFAVPVSADTEYGTGYIDPGFDFPTSYGFEDENELDYSASLPSSYDLRDENRVSPIRNQGQHGTCWAFASIASIESNLLTQGYTDICLLYTSPSPRD